MSGLKKKTAGKFIKDELGLELPEKDARGIDVEISSGTGKYNINAIKVVVFGEWKHELHRIRDGII